MMRIIVSRSALLVVLAASLAPVAVMMLCITLVLSGFRGSAQLPAECALVFGAAVHSVSDPGPAILRRVQTAADLYRAHQIERLIFTGGKGSDTQQSEADVMRAVAIADGVDDTSILTENDSNSTWENIAHSKKYLNDCSSVIAISDRYHLARISFITTEPEIFAHFSKSLKRRSQRIVPDSDRFQMILFGIHKPERTEVPAEFSDDDFQNIGGRNLNRTCF
jgi:vancomycin permeability regulator SanA